MGLKIVASLMLFGGALAAAPQLRLSQTAIGPVSVTAGANGTAPSVDFVNAGDGQLNPTVTSSATWLVPTRAGSRINIALQTSALARGTYTGFITVSDPNALDAPQTITATAQVGGGVPDRIDLYGTPTGTSTQARFTTNSPLATTINGNVPGLAVALEGAGSFRFTYTYVTAVQPVNRLADGTYQGNIVTAGSSIPTENKTVPVNLRVTSDPIATPSKDRVNFRIAQNGPRQTDFVFVNNIGAGSFALGNPTAATASGGNWLTVERVPNQNLVAIAADAATLSPGTYTGTVTIASNAVQGNLTVPVQLDVIASAPPTISYRGVVNNVTFEAGEALPQGGIVAMFGEQFSTAVPVSASSLPLGNELGGARVFVNDQPAPIYFVSANQINFQIPYNATIGDGSIRIERGADRGNAVSIRIARSAPKLIGPASGTGIGQPVVLYAIGLGPTDPAVASGVASPTNPLARAVGNYRVTFGSPGPFGGGAGEAVPFFVGLTPNFVGLYQINAIVPDSAPKGPNVPVRLDTDDGPSNTVFIAIE